MDNRSEFMDELTALINKHSVDNIYNTPDFILARYLIRCLEAYGSIKNEKENGRKI